MAVQPIQGKTRPASQWYRKPNRTRSRALGAAAAGVSFPQTEGGGRKAPSPVRAKVSTRHRPHPWCRP